VRRPISVAADRRQEGRAIPDRRGAFSGSSNRSAPPAYPGLASPTEAEAGLPDGDLVRRTTNGDVASFGLLVERYRKRAYFGALAWLGNRDEALDVTQEAFTRAYQAISRFDTSLPFYPWLYRIVRNLCFSRLRKKGGKGKAVTVSLSRPEGGAEPDRDVPDARFDPETLAARSELGDTVWEAINALSARDREIIIMNHFLDMSYQETAEAIGIPIGTVMSRLFYARKRLRERLSRFIESGGR